MSIRVSLLVCCLGLIEGSPAAGAQTTAKESAAPSTAATAPAPSAPASTPANVHPETDAAGRSLWWPGSNGDNSPKYPQGSTLTAQEALLPFQRGLLFLPYLGAALPLGTGSDSYTAGHSFGAMIGAHLTPGFSLTTEINVDFMNPGPSATESQTDFTVGALFQALHDRRLFVFGFKAGVYSLTRSVGDAGDTRSYATSSSADGYSATGLVWGVTLGGFIPVGPMALGCLARLTFRNLSSNCGEDGKDTICHEGEKYGISPALSVFNLSAAALF